jgi:hypothetical protein
LIRQQTAEEFMGQEDSTRKPAVKKIELPTERKQFKNLVLGNPNYFGTFPELGGKAVKPFSGNTTYEQLECLGLNPGSALLGAVINIKLHSGYGTDGCGAGTTEFVRFFVQDKTGWHDLGLASVEVYDIAGPLPLSYAVSVDFKEARKFCSIENIVHVRAILSWEWAPPPGNPNFIPVWGNVLNAEVQVAPQLLFEVPIAELITQKAISIDPGVLKDLNTAQPLPATPPNPLSYGELKALYAQEKVAAHRFGFEYATRLSDGPISNALNQIATAKLSTSASLVAGEDLAAVLAAIEKTKGDTTYEQLTCAGYNPQTRELEGVLHVKLSSGYSGGLCTHGSTEYVAFYALFGGVWNALGTAQVQVHDLKAASPAHPISYAVLRVSNLTSLPCEKLEGIPLRAVLSWSTPPTGPNFIPVWGNVVNTHVQPQIGVVADGEQMKLMRIGRVEVCSIDDTTGLAMPVTAVGPGCGAAPATCQPGPDDCVGTCSPFGGAPTVEGDFIPLNADSVFNLLSGAINPGAKPIIYQAWVTPSGGSAYQLTNGFWIELYPPAAIGSVSLFQTIAPPLGPVSGGVAGAQYYTYYESSVQPVNPRTLAVFDASALPEGNYTIEIRGFKWNTGLSEYTAITPQSKTIHVYNGYPHTEFFELTLGGPVVPVTEYRPQVQIDITAPSGDCGDVQVGDTVSGNYSVTDEFFGSLSIALVPIEVGGIIQPENPVILTVVSPPGSNPVAYDGTNTDGTSGTFTLDTTGMTPCGYTILLQAWDRALVSDNCYGHYNDIGVGFCLRKKGS